MPARTRDGTVKSARLCLHMTTDEETKFFAGCDEVIGRVRDRDGEDPSAVRTSTGPPRCAAARMSPGEQAPRGPGMG